MAIKIILKNTLIKKRMENNLKNNYPSITKILSSTQSKESQDALERWRLRVGLEVAEKIKEDAIERGIKYDKYVQDFYNKKEIPHKQLANHLQEYELHSLEQNVKSDIYKYKGRYDCIFIKNNILILNDFKGSTKEKQRKWLNDYPLQISAYCKALEEDNIYVNYAMITVILDDRIQKFIFNMNQMECFFKQFLIRLNKYKNETTY